MKTSTNKVRCTCRDNMYNGDELLAQLF